MSSNPFEQRPYQRSNAIASLLFWLFWHGLVLTTLAVVLLGIVPRFDRMFEEFGLKLPVLTVLVINASRGLRSYGILLIPVGALFHVGMLCLLTLVDGVPRWFRTVWGCGVIFSAGATLLIIAIGIMVPLLGLVQGLS